jgi:hypothetical protein
MGEKAHSKKKGEGKPPPKKKRVLNLPHLKKLTGGFVSVIFW